MTTLFDSKMTRPATPTFGRGLDRPTDQYGNVLPVAKATAADLLYAAEVLNAETPDYDRMAEDHENLDRVCRGHVGC